jgi:hypothetical protein
MPRLEGCGNAKVVPQHQASVVQQLQVKVWATAIVNQGQGKNVLRQGHCQIKLQKLHQRGPLKRPRLRRQCLLQHSRQWHCV